MRSLSVTQIKRKLKGKKVHLYQEKPTKGSRLREMFDLLTKNLGQPVDLKLNRTSKGILSGEYNRLKQLEMWYGLDIRTIQRAKYGQDCLHVLVGEWFGRIYVDYTAD